MEALACFLARLGGDDKVASAGKVLRIWAWWQVGSCVGGQHRGPVASSPRGPQRGAAGAWGEPPQESGWDEASRQAGESALERRHLGQGALGKGPEWEEVWAEMPLGVASWPWDRAAMEVQRGLRMEGLGGACRCSAEPEEGARVPPAPSPLGCPWTPTAGPVLEVGRCAGAGAGVCPSSPGLRLTLHKPPPSAPHNACAENLWLRGPLRAEHPHPSHMQQGG